MFYMFSRKEHHCINAAKARVTQVKNMLKDAFYEMLSIFHRKKLHECQFPFLKIMGEKVEKSIVSHIYGRFCLQRDCSTPCSHHVFVSDRTSLIVCKFSRLTLTLRWVFANFRRNPTSSCDENTQSCFIICNLLHCRERIARKVLPADKRMPNSVSAQWDQKLNKNDFSHFFKKKKPC